MPIAIDSQQKKLFAAGVLFPHLKEQGILNGQAGVFLRCNIYQ
jgi:hypothetical protein